VNGTGSKRAMLLGDTRIGYERGMDIKKQSIAPPTVSESAMKEQKMVEEHGLKLLEDDKSVNPRNVLECQGYPNDSVKPEAG